MSISYVALLCSKKSDQHSQLFPSPHFCVDSLQHRCTRGQARSITFRPREEYEALQAARQRESTEVFKEAYRKRAGVEGTLSQAIRIAGMRRSRYIGLEKTHLQNIVTAVAINLHRVINWMNSIPLAPTRKSRFAALAA